MVCFWDRNQCKQSNGTAERNLVNKCQCFLTYLLTYNHNLFIAQLLLISLIMWINNILSYVFNACLFVYFRFNFQPVLVGIHVIFSWAQLGRSASFGREIGVPDREIFSRQKIFKFNVKNCLFASP